MIKLGSEVEDVVTGFKGIITARAEYLNGCMRLYVQPKVDKDGKHQEGLWIDEPQLIMTGETNIQPGTRDKGGPIQNAPTRNVTPTR